MLRASPAERVRLCFAAVRRTGYGCAPRGSANRRETDTTGCGPDCHGLSRLWLVCRGNVPTAPLPDTCRSPRSDGLLIRSPRRDGQRNPRRMETGSARKARSTAAAFRCSHVGEGIIVEECDTVHGCACAAIDHRSAPGAATWMCLRQMAEDWQRNRRRFAGLVLGPQLAGTLGQCVKDLELIVNASEPGECLNIVERLPL